MTAATTHNLAQTALSDLDALLERHAITDMREATIARLFYKHALDSISEFIGSHVDAQDERKMVGETKFRRLNIPEHDDNDWVDIRVSGFPDGLYIVSTSRSLSKKENRVSARVVGGRIINVHPDQQLPVGRLYIWLMENIESDYANTFQTVLRITRHACVEQELRDIAKAIHDDETY